MAPVRLGGASKSSAEGAEADWAPLAARMAPRSVDSLGCRMERRPVHQQDRAGWTEMRMLQVDYAIRWCDDVGAAQCEGRGIDGKRLWYRMDLGCSISCGSSFAASDQIADTADTAGVAGHAPS